MKWVPHENVNEIFFKLKIIFLYSPKFTLKIFIIVCLPFVVKNPKVIHLKILINSDVIQFMKVILSLVLILFEVEHLDMNGIRTCTISGEVKSQVNASQKKHVSFTCAEPFYVMFG